MDPNNIQNQNSAMPTPPNVPSPFTVNDPGAVPEPVSNQPSSPPGQNMAQPQPVQPAPSQPIQPIQPQPLQPVQPAEPVQYPDLPPIVEGPVVASNFPNNPTQPIATQPASNDIDGLSQISTPPFSPSPPSRSLQPGPNVPPIQPAPPSPATPDQSGPQYGTQLQPGQTFGPQKKKSPLMVVAIVVLILIVVGAAVYLVFFAKGSGGPTSKNASTSGTKASPSIKSISVDSSATGGYTVDNSVDPQAQQAGVQGSLAYTNNSAQIGQDNITYVWGTSAQTSNSSSLSATDKQQLQQAAQSVKNDTQTSSITAQVKGSDGKQYPLACKITTLTLPTTDSTPIPSETTYNCTASFDGGKQQLVILVGPDTDANNLKQIFNQFINATTLDFQ